MLIRHAELRNGSDMCGRAIPLVRRPSVSGIVDLLHEVIACDLRKDRRRSDDCARRIGLDLHMDGQLTPKGILRSVNQAEKIIGSGQPIVGAVQEHATGNEAMAGYLGECAAPSQTQGRDNTPLINFLRRGVTDG